MGFTNSNDKVTRVLKEMKLGEFLELSDLYLN